MMSTSFDSMTDWSMLLTTSWSLMILRLSSPFCSIVLKSIELPGLSTCIYETTFGLGFSFLSFVTF